MRRIGLALLLLFPLFLFAVYVQSTKTETFGCSNGTTPSGWTNVKNTVVCQSGKGAGGTAFDFNVADYTGLTFNYDQDVKMTLSTFDGSNEFCVFARNQNSVTNPFDGYSFCTNGSSGAGNTYIQLYNGGAQTVLENIATTFTANDVLEIKIVGTTISAYKNGAQVGTSTTDGTWQTGNPAVQFYSTTMRGSNWIATDLSTGSGNTADMQTDWENSADGTAITATIASNASHPTPPWGAVSQSANPLVGSTISISGQHIIGGSFVVDGTTYKDAAGTRGYRYDLGTNSESVRWTFPVSQAQVSVGYWFNTGLLASGFTGHSINILGTVSGTEFCVAPYVYRNNDGNDHFTVETINNLPAGGAGGDGNYVATSSGTWYWITSFYDTVGGNCKMNVYDVNLVQVGTTQTKALIASPPNTTYFEMGQNTGHAEGGLGGTYNYFDNLSIDWTLHVFPLLPAVNSNNGAMLCLGAGWKSFEGLKPPSGIVQKCKEGRY